MSPEEFQQHPHRRSQSDLKAKTKVLKIKRNKEAMEKEGVGLAVLEK